MYRLTQRRKDMARDILDRHAKCLHDTRWMDIGGLERELHDLWGLGYKTLKGIMIDMMSNHPEYAHLAAYYMEHANAPGVVSEFQRPLAKLYGLTSWYYDDSKEQKREEFWDTAFAVISQFDLDADVDGQNILQVGSFVNAKLIQYFLDHPTDLRTMDSRHFEELIAELFDGFGYLVELTTATRDNGRDVIAIGNETVAKSKYLIECKRYAELNKVGIQPVRSLHGVVTDERATKGIIATTSTFTAPANEFLERNKWTLEGRDFDGVLDWLKAYQKLKFPPNVDA
jgi:hypothetical protein